MAKQPECLLNPTLQQELIGVLEAMQSEGYTEYGGKPIQTIITQVGACKDFDKTMSKRKRSRPQTEYNKHMSQCTKGTGQFEAEGKRDWTTCVGVWNQLKAEGKVTTKAMRKAQGISEPIAEAYKPLA